MLDLDLDEKEILALKHYAKVITEELQDTKNKLFKVQNEKEEEGREAMDKINTLTAEKLVLTDEVSWLKEELRDVKGKLEKERKKKSEQEMEVERLKLKCLQDEFNHKKNFLLNKTSDNEKLITITLHQDSLDKLNQFSAVLSAGLEELAMKYEERRLAIQQQRSNNLDLEFDLSRFSGPRIDNIEIETLKLLVNNISLTKTPPQPLSPPPGLQPGEAAALPSILVSGPGHQPPPGSLGRMTPVKAPSPPAPAAGAVSGEAGPSAAEKAKMTTTRKMTKLREKTPDLTTEQVDKYRVRNGGKLSGLSVNDIKNAGEKLWKEEGGSETVSGVFGAVGRGRHNPVVGGAQYMPAEDPECTICLEKVDNNSVNTRELQPCGHKFHRTCIEVSLRASRLNSGFS